MIDLSTFKKCTVTRKSLSRWATDEVLLSLQQSGSDRGLDGVIVIPERHMKRLGWITGDRVDVYVKNAEIVIARTPDGELTLCAAKGGGKTKTAGLPIRARLKARALAEIISAATSKAGPTSAMAYPSTAIKEQRILLLDCAIPMQQAR